MSTEGPLEVTVLTPAAGLKTDISGLVLVREEQMEARASQIESSVSSYFSEIQEMLSKAPIEELLQRVKLQRKSRWLFWRARNIVLSPKEIHQVRSELWKQIQSLPAEFARATKTRE